MKDLPVEALHHGTLEALEGFVHLAQSQVHVRPEELRDVFAIRPERQGLEHLLRLAGSPRHPQGMPESGEREDASPREGGGVAKLGDRLLRLRPQLMAQT